MKELCIIIFGIYFMAFKSYSQVHNSTIIDADINKCLEKVSEKDPLNERNKVIRIVSSKSKFHDCKTFWVSSAISDLKHINIFTTGKIVGHFDKAIVIYKSHEDTTKRIGEDDVLILRDILDSYLVGNKEAYKKMEMFIKDRFTEEERKKSKFPDYVSYTRECFIPKVTICPNGDINLIYE